jgi:hypothetical protein
MPNQRKHVWVDRFQTKLLYRMGLYWVVYTLTLFNLLLAWRLLWGEPGDLWRECTATVYDNGPLFLALLLAVPWITWDAVRFSNRLVGPLARFREAMNGIAANKPVRRIQLRQGDFLVEMQDDFNALLTALKQRGAVNLEHPDDARSAK